MRTKALLAFAASIALFWTVSAVNVRADQWNQATKLTFNAPVEVPGMVLPAGTYLFTVMPDDPAHNVVQIWNGNHTKFYDTVMTVPDYRRKPSGNPVLMFDHTGTGAPQTVEAWFYPGDLYGHDFVYPKSRATELARETGRPVPSMPDEVAANGNKSSANSVNDSAISAMTHSQIKAERPTGEEVDVYEVIQAPPAQGASQTNPR